MWEAVLSDEEEPHVQRRNHYFHSISQKALVIVLILCQERPENTQMMSRCEVVKELGLVLNTISTRSCQFGSNDIVLDSAFTGNKWISYGSLESKYDDNSRR